MKSLDKKLDKLWTSAVLHTGCHKCLICGATEKLNAHHIVGRRNLRLRWEVFNGVVLCTLHHVFGRQSAHQNPEWMHYEMEDKNWENLQKIVCVMNEEKHWTAFDKEQRIKELEDYISLLE